MRPERFKDSDNGLQVQTGASMVEAAIALLLFLVFVAAIIDFSWVVYRKIMLAHAVRYGSHAGALMGLPYCSGREAKASEQAKLKLASLFYGGYGEVSILAASLDSDGDVTNGYELLRVLAVDLKPSCLLFCHFWPALGQPISANSTRKYEAGACIK